MKKNYVDFLRSKLWQILKQFAGTFHQAQTFKLWGVIYHTIKHWLSKNCYDKLTLLTLEHFISQADRCWFSNLAASKLAPFWAFSILWCAAADFEQVSL